MAPWVIESRSRITSGHGQTEPMVRIVKPGLPAMIEVSVYGPDDAADKLAAYVLEALNLLDSVTQNTPRDTPPAGKPRPA